MRQLLLVLALLLGPSAPLVPLVATAAEPGPVARAISEDRGASSAGKRRAVVVGTSTYTNTADWHELPNARSDADALANELSRRYGYEVTRLANPDTNTFKRALVAVAAAAGPDDDLLIFVAGHGWFDAEDKAGYLVFADGEAGCARGCYPLDNVKRALFDSRARHVLVMLDACYAGTFDIRVALGGATDRGATASDPASLRRIRDDYAQYPSRLVLASIGKEPTSDGTRGAHSPFMARVLGTLSRPGPGGIVSLDSLWTALQVTGPDGPLKVGRPAPFEAARPHHPNGTFLFISDVGFCEALSALTDAARVGDGFASLRAGPERASVWGSAWSAAWTLPGASSCDVWRWGADGSSELRCELGSMSEPVATRHAALVLADVRACLRDADGWAETTGETHGSENLPDVRRARSAPSDGRAVTLTTTCADDCTMSLVFE
jgi:hypothetical protein